MKKATTKIMLIALVIVTLLTIVPLSATASTDSNKTKVYSFLTREIGFNSAAACGIMANIERESNFKPNIVARDSNGLYSGGLCMWNGSRFTNLKNYCNKNGYDYLSIEGQMHYLQYELQTSGYKHIYNYLMNVSNSSSGAYNAAYYWCYYFEIPANKAVKAKQRGNIAISSYWPVYGNKTLKKPVLTLNGNVIHFDSEDSLTLTWTTGGSNTTDYKLYVAKKNMTTGAYDWANSKIYTHKASSRVQKIDLSKYELGIYGAYVKSIHSPTENSAKSNYVVFSVNCYTHKYESMITKEPTFTSTGIKTFTCVKCATQKQEQIPALTSSTFKDTRMYTPFATAVTTNAIRLEWQPMTGVSGYMVYVRENGAWKFVSYTKASDAPYYTAKNLQAGTDYKYCIRGYVNIADVRYYSTVSPSVIVSTRTDTPDLISVTAANGSAKLTWSNVSGEDGYVVYVATSKNGPFKGLTKLGENVTSYTAKNLQEGTTYYFSVRSYQNTTSGYLFSYSSAASSVVPA